MSNLSRPSIAALLLSAAALSPATALQYGGAFEIEQAIYNFSGNERHGSACAYVGDVNADSIGDFLVAAPGFDGVSLLNNGAVRLISGADGSLIHQFEGVASFDRMGQSVCAIPDIDADLIPDFAISSLAGEGEVTLWSGATQLLIDTIAAPVGAHDFGCDLALIDDLSSNGMAELLIGAENTEVLGVAVGAVYAYDLSTRTSVQIVTGLALGDSFGCAVAPIADCNADGLADYLVSSPGADPGGMNNAGSVFLISGADGSTILQVDGSRPGLFLGNSVLGLDDLDLDGTPDFAIGTIRDFPTGSGGLYIGSVGVHSGADGSELRRHWGDDSYEHFGQSLAIAGDYEGDGKNEYLVGAPGSLYGGRVYVYYSSLDSGMTILESDGPDDEHGIAMAYLGDHDGDGSEGLLVCAPGADGGVVNGGVAYVREFTSCMTASAMVISNAAGGVVTYDLDFPEDFTNKLTQTYQVLLSGAGAGATDLFGLTAPVGDDNLYRDSLVKKYPGPLSTPFGNLAPDGTASFSATFAAGTLPQLVGRTFHLSAAWYEQGGGQFVLRGFAHAIPITIEP
jgi:hypothetical protein